jgi:hypothetical protein
MLQFALFDYYIHLTLPSFTIVLQCQMVEKLKKQIQGFAMQCDDNAFMHNYIWCKTFTSKQR